MHVDGIIQARGLSTAKDRRRRCAGGVGRRAVDLRVGGARRLGGEGVWERCLEVFFLRDRILDVGKRVQGVVQRYAGVLLLVEHGGGDGLHEEYGADRLSLGVVHPAPCRRPNHRFLPGVLAGKCPLTRLGKVPPLPRAAMGYLRSAGEQRSSRQSSQICRTVNERSRVPGMRRLHLPDLPRTSLGDRCKYGLSVGNNARSVIAGQDDDRDAASLQVDLLGHVPVGGVESVEAVCICRRDEGLHPGGFASPSGRR